MINSASTVHLGWVKNTEAKVETQRRRWVRSRVEGRKKDENGWLLVVISKTGPTA